MKKCKILILTVLWMGQGAAFASGSGDYNPAMFKLEMHAEMGDKKALSQLRLAAQKNMPDAKKQLRKH